MSNQFYPKRKNIILQVNMRPEALQFPVLAYQQVLVEAQQSLLLVALPDDGKNLHTSTSQRRKSQHRFQDIQ